MGLVPSVAIGDLSEEPDQSLEKARGEGGKKAEEILGEISILDSLLSMTGTNGEDNNTEQKNAIE